MKSSYVAVALLGAAALVQSANADPVNVGDWINFSAGPGATTGSPGGEFNIHVYQSGYSFTSFCLEREEAMFFGPGSFGGSGGSPSFTHPFEVVGITDRAFAGGINTEDPGPGDPISSRTAYLYQNFVRGTLAGYDYAGPNRVASADALQNAIWFLEEEIADPFDGIADPATQALITSFLNLDLGAFTGIGDVRVLNIVYRWDGPGGVAGGNGQDILVVVPLPQTFGLGMAGLLGVVGVTARRRR